MITSSIQIQRFSSSRCKLIYACAIYSLSASVKAVTSGSSNKRIMWLLQSFVYLGVISSLLDWPCALANPMEKTECPQVQLAIPVDGICPEECRIDAHCPFGLKCCSYGCGHVCVKPAPAEKEGVCPELQRGTAGICMQECETDFDCKGDLKCCNNGCGHVCSKPDHAICNQPNVAGPCAAYYPRWFFNAASGLCESFIYGGCGGNDNNFETKSECEKECGGTTEPDICSQPKVAGPCKGYFPRWFFNAASGSCEKFIYGGCGGNDNNFESQKECENKCGGCPDGEPLVNCLRDPCEDAVCNAHPNAKCTANYCGGCNTDWTENGKPVDCGRWGK